MASPAPISEAQLAANRANAQRSTGPATPDGKSRTRLNGLRHGLTGQTALLPDEDRAAWDSHHAAFLAEFSPEGVLESQLAHGIADDYWRLNRIRAIESNIFALGIEAHAGEFADDPMADTALAQARTYLDTAKEINLLSLYESRLNRAVHKKHAELAELQRLRKAAERSGLIATAAPAKTTTLVGGFAFSERSGLIATAAPAEPTAVVGGFAFSEPKFAAPRTPEMPARERINSAACLTRVGSEESSAPGCGFSKETAHCLP